jgi:hypothetical protein
MRRATITILAIALLGAGCGLVPLPSAPPSDAVRGAVERMAAHDLVGANRFACQAHRDPNKMPFVIGAILSPLADFPPLPVPETLALIDIDTRDLRMVDPPGDLRDEVKAEVELRGSLWLSVDPDEVEAAVRAGPRIFEDEPLDEALLAQNLAEISPVPVRVPVQQWVPVVREEGEWRVCDETRVPGGPA